MGENAELSRMTQATGRAYIFYKRYKRVGGFNFC